MAALIAGPEVVAENMPAWECNDPLLLIWSSLTSRCLCTLYSSVCYYSIHADGSLLEVETRM